MFQFIQHVDLLACWRSIRSERRKFTCRERYEERYLSSVSAVEGLEGRGWDICQLATNCIFRSVDISSMWSHHNHCQHGNIPASQPATVLWWQKVKKTIQKSLCSAARRVMEKCQGAVKSQDMIQDRQRQRGRKMISITSIASH